MEFNSIGIGVSISDVKDEWVFPRLLQSSSPEAWVLTDNLLDAYFANRFVPPELAVWSGKRMNGGYLSTETLISIVKKRQPEQILLRRFQQNSPPFFFISTNTMSGYGWSNCPTKPAITFVQRSLAMMKAGIEERGFVPSDV